MTTEGAVEIQDNGRYERNFDISVAAAEKIELRAANEHRPTVILSGDAQIQLGENAQATINGLLISGKGQYKLHVPDAGWSFAATLRLSHCTFVPSGSVCSSGLTNPA